MYLHLELKVSPHVAVRINCPSLFVVVTDIIKPVNYGLVYSDSFVLKGRSLAVLP